MKVGGWSVCLWALCIIGNSALCSEESSNDKPFLRIETGMHMATIKRIHADWPGRFLVTGSEDKTVRVWELSSGRLLRILRPPIGSGDVGKIYAVALSPNGETVVAGGWTRLPGQAGNNIYRWHRRDGHMLPPIGGLPNVVNDLAFSPDGERLAAVLGNGELRAFRASDGTEMARDTRCKKGSYSVAFDHRRHLATSCLDGQIRIYDASLKNIVETKAPGGNHPYQVRFSPDGRHLAVGYEDSVRVDVLSSKDLRLIRQPDVKGINNGNLGRIAWSPDGRFLFAAGQFHRAGTFPVLRWAKAGRGSRIEWALGESPITDLEALPDGRLAFAAANPAWGVVDGSGSLKPQRRSVTVDFGDLLEGSWASEEGASVRWAYRSSGKDLAVFSVARLQFETEEPPSLLAPRIEHDRLQVESWKDSYEPKIGGRPLPLEAFEMSRSLAISSRGDVLVIGTDWSLHRFDRQGERRWLTDVPGTARAVNLAARDQLVLAAFGDGTIRWYRAEDGQELLAFFPHADKSRWVAWTPSGYYAASVQGEDLIGWHINRKPDQSADFFPVSALRNQYHRPDVVQLILKTRDEGKAVSQANAARRLSSTPPAIEEILPPVVEILQPQDDQLLSGKSVQLRVWLRSPSGAPVLRLRTYLDGKQVQARKVELEEDPAQDSIPEGEIRILEVPLPPHDCRVGVRAENVYAASRFVSIGIRRPTQPEVRLPELYLLAVGVSTYQTAGYNLEFAAKDARDFAALWESQQGKIYRQFHKRLLVDKEASNDNILDGFEWLERNVTSRDVAIIFLAGHGLNDTAEGNYHFLPHNADPDHRRRTYLPDHAILSAVRSIGGKRLVFLDTCNAGNLPQRFRNPAAVDITRIVNELVSAENGIIVFSASRGRQFSQESSEWNNGAFTKALVEGFRGKADVDKNQALYVTEIEGYVYQRVKELTKGQQTPVVAKPKGVEDFPLAWVVKGAVSGKIEKKEPPRPE